MTTEIIVNTGPLITLAKIDALHVVGRLPYRFISPKEVHEELKAGEAMGYTQAIPQWLEIKSTVASIGPVVLTALDLGESAVIQMAMERKTQWVCIDEWKARRAALSVGLDVVGVLGLLARAKKDGIIDRVFPYVRKAIDEGVRYHPELVRRILSAIGEA